MPLTSTVAVEFDSADSASNDWLRALNSTKFRVVVELVVVAVGVSQTRTMRSGSGKGSGLNSTPSTRLNIAVLAPMPSASTLMATSVNTGSRRSETMP